MVIKIDPIQKRRILKNHIFNKLLIKELDETKIVIKGYTAEEIKDAIDELVYEKKVEQFSVSALPF